MCAAFTMNPRDGEQATLDAASKHSSQLELIDRIGRAVPADGVVEPMSGVFLARVSTAGEPMHSVTRPSFCVIAQGSKETLLGDCRYRYDAASYLLTTLELPRVSQVLEASPAQPYLSFRLVLTPDVVRSVVMEAGGTAPSTNGDERAIAVSPLDADLLDAVVRLTRLVDRPDEARVLKPLITREIVYRLLLGEQGDRLRHMVAAEGYTPPIARAIERLRRDFDQPLRMEQLAGDLGMSVSSFHHRFKDVTAMSPLQYQKRIRLQEARRLMLNEDFDAASAAFRVGYQDASHFSREYKGLFGFPPMRDVQRLRGSASEAAG